MTDAVEHVLHLPLDRLADHPRNVRRHLGDLKEGSGFHLMRGSR